MGYRVGPPELFPPVPQLVLNPFLQYLYTRRHGHSHYAGNYNYSQPGFRSQHRPPTGSGSGGKVDPYSVHRATSDRPQTVNKEFIMKARLRVSIPNFTASVKWQKKGVLSTGLFMFPPPGPAPASTQARPLATLLKVVCYPGVSFQPARRFSSSYYICALYLRSKIMLFQSPSDRSSPLLQGASSIFSASTR